MKKIFLCLFICGILLLASGKYLPEQKKLINTADNQISDEVFVSDERYMPLNFKNQYAMWFTSMDYADTLYERSEDEFRAETVRRFYNAMEMGVNTVYVQVRSFCDAYYPSEYYPAGKYYTDTDYDPLEIMVDEAHNLGLSFHAWINPLRCVMESEIDSISREYKFAEWYDKGKYIFEADERLWLDPSFKEVREYISAGVKEITENYDVDGIHIDDYFYPSADEEFDRKSFEASGESDLLKWRRNNINLLVSDIYRTVKASGKDILFGISPQGNMDKDLNEQCADVLLWMREEGYCDYITPQLYYGYNNDECPFEDVLEKWSEASSDKVNLVIGLCTYKYGTQDKWAGSGINEWLDDNNITVRQIKDSLADKNTDGLAFYSYASTFEDEVSSDIMTMGPVQEIRQLIRSN